MQSSQTSRGVAYLSIEHLQDIDKASKVKGRFSGILLKVSRDANNYIIFSICDGTGTAQITTLYKNLHEDLELPKAGDSIEVFGDGYRKVLGGTNNSYMFNKIVAYAVRKISIEQEMRNAILAQKNHKKKMKKINQSRPTEQCKLEPQMKQRSFNSNQEKTVLRTIVLNYCYYVFEHNTDIQSYIFNPEMVRRNKQCIECLKDSRISRTSLEKGILQAMKQMAGMQVLKQKQSDKDLFVVKRQLFKQIEKYFMQKVLQDEDKGGITIAAITTHVNNKINEKFNINVMLFDSKFAQTVLRKLQEQNKVYKTSDKLIFPNIRH